MNVVIWRKNISNIGRYIVRHFQYIFRSNGKLLGKKLQVVAQELSRAAAILQDEEDDSITIFDEIKKNLEKNKIVLNWNK